MMKDLLSRLKPFLKLLLTLVSLLSIYVCISILEGSTSIPVPFHFKPDAFEKLLSLSTTILAALLTWITFQVDIELFSGPEVVAFGYVETFCKNVVDKFNLKPCYIFILEHLAELNRPEDYVTEIQNKGLNCTFDPKTRVHTVVNPANKKQAYLDFPSTLKNLAKVAGKDERYKNKNSLEENLIRSFKKHVERELGITYKGKGIWQKLDRVFRSGKRVLEERSDLVPFYFAEPTAIRNEPLAGFKQLE